MIVFVIGIIACGHLSLEARKRAESGVKWGLIALIAFFGPQLIIPAGIDPIARGILNYEHGHPLQFGIAIASVIAGFWLFIVARKRLYNIARLIEEHSDTDIVVDNYDIVEKPDGTFLVSGRVFPSKRDAEEFISFIKRRSEQ